MNRRTALMILVAAFVLSILLRLPTLQRPVSIWRDYNTAFFLIPMMIWDETGGPSNHLFMHCSTFNNVGDKDNPHLGSLNDKGTCYYHSFPTFSLVLPYYSFKIFGIEPTPIAIRIFNLMLEFLTIFLIFEILQKILSGVDLFVRNSSALTGSVIYLFSPGSLFYHGNGYTHHVLVVTLVMATLYFYVFFHQQQKTRWLLLFLFFLFLSMITEWVSYFLAFGFFIVEFFLHRKSRLQILTGLAGVGVMALLVFLLPPILKFGYTNFIQLTTEKFAHRSLSSEGSSESFLGIVTGIIQHFKSMHLPVIVILIGLAILFFLKKGSIKFTKLEIMLLGMLIGSAWMHHVIFMNFTLPHDYSTLIDLSYLSTGAGLLISKLSAEKKIVWGILTIAVVGGSVIYTHYNRPGEYSIDQEPYNYTQQMAETILKQVDSETVIFIQSFTGNASFCPPMAYHLKRNYFIFHQKEDVRKLVEERKIVNYVIVFTHQYQVTSITKSL